MLAGSSDMLRWLVLMLETSGVRAEHVRLGLRELKRLSAKKGPSGRFGQQHDREELDNDAASPRGGVGFKVDCSSA
jgi:hypothetical protein